MCNVSVAQRDATLGDLLPSSYKDNITAFHDQFRKAVEIFKGKLQMDQYQLVADTGKYRSHAGDRCPNICRSQPSMWP